MEYTVQYGECTCVDPSAAPCKASAGERSASRQDAMTAESSGLTASLIYATRS